MLRNGGTRVLVRGLKSSPRFPSPRKLSTIPPLSASISLPSCSLSLKRPQSFRVTEYRPISLAIQRYATTTGPPFDHIDAKKEAKIAGKKLEVEPEDVSTQSSVRSVFEEGQGQEEVDMLAGVKQDLQTIRETFVLSDVPREAYYIGLAGVLPYLATSLSTVYLAWDINHAALTGSGFLLDGRTAELLLHIIEPLQVGYGAVIISFLGAIHWGLEFAKYGGEHGYRRYAIGVIAPAIAWPTILFPVEYALITQFLAFNFLYFTDARATVHGWCPPWYSTYRFVLTFIVGASIVLSLIGRGQIADKVGRSHGPADRVKALKDAQWENLEKEEREKRAKMVAEEEGEDEE